MSTKVGSISDAGRGASSTLPPGPRMPSALQAIGWARRPLPFMERCQRRYGDIFTLRIRHGGTWVLLCDPEDVKRVFACDPEAVGMGIANTLLGPVLGTRSVMLLEEPEHMTRRKLMLRSFTGKPLEGYGRMMAEVARREIASWPVAEPFELWPRMQTITLEVTMRAVFGAAETDHLRRLRGPLRELTEWMNDSRRLTLAALFGPRSIVRSPSFRRVMAPVEAMVLAEIQRRRAQADFQGGADILSMLEQARYEDGSLMSEQDLRDELITLLSDGPASTLLAWLFERLLLGHPARLARLQREVLAGGDGDDDDGVYLDAVVKETMRLCPAVPIVVRRLVEPMRLGDHTLPADTYVAPCIHLIHRREDVYPRAHSFMPERFLTRQAGAYTWIPFGGGVRRCIAAGFATLEMKQVIRAVLGEVDLHPVQSRSERVRRSAVAFSPGQRGLVLLTRRAPGPVLTPTPEDSTRPAPCLRAA
jgi:cytochrome P450 family 135